MRLVIIYSNLLILLDFQKMSFKPIDALPGLVAHLGKARADRIRYAQNGRQKRQPGATNIPNPILNEMQDEEPDATSPINDILSGLARSDEGKPLSVRRLYNILQCMPIINTREICLMMAVDVRQAQRYLRVIKIALPFLIRAIQKTKTRKNSHGKEEQED